jgi:hypothetical protein
MRNYPTKLLRSVEGSPVMIAALTLFALCPLLYLAFLELVFDESPGK